MEPTKKALITDKAPAAIGPYSQAVRFGQFLFISGQIPLDPSSGDIVGERIEEQTRQVMKNLQGVLEAAGLSFRDIVKTSVFLQDLNEFVPFNQIYSEFLSEPYPARACVEVAALPKGVRVEIEAIACYS